MKINILYLIIKISKYNIFEQYNNKCNIKILLQSSMKRIQNIIQVVYIVEHV